MKKIPRLKPGDAIEIIWIDSHSMVGTWQDASEVMCQPEFTIRSVCQYLGRDKDFITTVADRSPEQPDGVMRDMKIPRGCIKRVKKLGGFKNVRK